MPLKCKKNVDYFSTCCQQVHHGNQEVKISRVAGCKNGFPVITENMTNIFKYNIAFNFALIALKSQNINLFFFVMNAQLADTS